MNNMTILIIACFIFCIGYDMASYNIMRKVDRLYKKRNKWFFGYNTYMVWKTSRTTMKEE
jgi:hypothetical protein